ncbi:MAG TPA: glycosyltransferase family 39 protein [Bacteroidia bacterium]|nr:glycosyltransferase family 39 protein [Bacteroidia bacterium]
MSKKITTVTAFTLWSIVVLSSFYISQRPLFFQVMRSSFLFFGNITLTFLFLFNAAGLGYFIFKQFRLQADLHERLLLGTGLGLGILGITGYWLGVLGLAQPTILFSLLIVSALFVLLKKFHTQIGSDLKNLFFLFSETKAALPKWTVWVVIITCCIGFIYTFLPPAEGFDGLLYHLRLPELLLADNGLKPYNNFPLWFPSLIEGNYIWALSLNSERTAQMLHWSYAMLSLIIVWKWSYQVFGAKAAWWSLVIIVSMPSLPLLSSWAYTDFGLIFFSLSCTYCLWCWLESQKTSFIALSGVFAGFAMGVKYTSFILPLFCILYILLNSDNIYNKNKSLFIFSSISILAALPWYIRNWIVMNNPFYPFVFGGRYWDPFLTQWYNNPGSGIGFDLRELLFLPFTLTMGFRDVVYFDGRIGPLFLLLFPLVIWIIFKKYTSDIKGFKLLILVFFFFTLSFAAWVFGIIQTVGLWQSRLLWPGFFHLVIPIGAAIANIQDLDIYRIRLSFITTTLIGIVTFTSLLDSGLFLIARRPLINALGLETRAQYFDRIQPEYSEALKLVNNLPKESMVYFLFEPRSYNMKPFVQPDPINSNLMHDYYIYKTPERIISFWKSSGYTHILVNNASALFIEKEEHIEESKIKEIINLLHLKKKGQSYSLYIIP